MVVGVGGGDVTICLAVISVSEERERERQHCTEKRRQEQFTTAGLCCWWCANILNLNCVNNMFKVFRS